MFPRMKRDRKPWEKRKWRGGIIRPPFGANILMPLIVGAAFAGVAYGIFRHEPNLYSFRKEGAIASVSYVMASGAVFFTLLLVKGLVSALRFRGTKLKLLTNPGIIGGPFRGELWLPRGSEGKAGIRFQLINESYHTTTGSDGDSHNCTGQHFEYSIRVDDSKQRSEGRHTVIPFSFTVPFDTRDETDRKSDKRRSTSYGWLLKTTCPQRGLDLEFRVPIFRTSDSRRQITRASLPKHTFEEIAGNAERASYVAIDDRRGEIVYACKAMRAIKKRAVLLIGALMFIMGPYFCFEEVFLRSGPDLVKALRNGDIPDALFSGLFVVIPGLIGLVFLAISLAMFLWFALGVATRVTTISPEGLRLRIGLGPIRFGGFTPFADIQSVTQSSAESSDGQALYDIQLTLKEHAAPSRWRRNKVLACGIPSAKEAQWILQHIRKSMRRYGG
jgi:hypothetical protein